MTKKQDQPSSDIAFTPSVKAVQKRKGSRVEFLEQEAEGGWATAITPSLAEFISQVRTCYLATATAEGQPYVQHRGGAPGFLQVLDPHTLGFADFRGNRQYVTTGNLDENPRAFLFLIDYIRSRRVKLWGTARVVENDPELSDRLLLKNYPADAEQVILFTVKAWDVNCPRHIPTMVPMEEVSKLCKRFETRIEELERENASLKEGTTN
ncbi:pyridoxamine 5'-phosphate oxidase family protein [Sedimenticola hydrogenitrophicus]|uniref:pyridoxamine 5'-phosphate oxidase family protein n=1 Tax=Sedimenticola hydrogenitrophicus TaxID=2967975 RepID=UPI0023B0E8C6|nr:pyridoxamine 5'-phosphate oxidase family protein [Sedimenticola hydrogenitrophicus]